MCTPPPRLHKPAPTTLATHLLVTLHPPTTRPLCPHHAPTTGMDEHTPNPPTNSAHFPVSSQRGPHTARDSIPGTLACTPHRTALSTPNTAHDPSPRPHHAPHPPGQRSPESAPTLAPAPGCGAPPSCGSAPTPCSGAAAWRACQRRRAWRQSHWTCRCRWGRRLRRRTCGRGPRAARRRSS